MYTILMQLGSLIVCELLTEASSHASVRKYACLQRYISAYLSDCIVCLGKLHYEWFMQAIVRERILCPYMCTYEYELSTYMHGRVCGHM